MHYIASRRYWLGGLLAALLTLIMAAMRVPSSAADPLALPPISRTVRADKQPTLTSTVPPASPMRALAGNDTVTVVTASAEPKIARPVEQVVAPKLAAAPSSANAVPTPTPRPPGTPPRVGLQVGHWKSNELPDELSRLRTSTGAFSNGVSEMQVNLDVAQRVAKLLQSVGIVVDVLPATVPPGYDADAFVAIHADGVKKTGPHGFKLATPWRFSRAAAHLLGTVTQEYGRATGMRQDGAITFNMRGYYAFQWRRHQHAIARTTPGVIIEMGFITNPNDRRMLTQQQDTVAIGIANGIIRYLNERDPNDGAALVAPDFAVQRAISPNGVDVRAEPRDNARVLLHVGPDKQIVPLSEQNDWYQVVVRGEWQRIGWVRKDQVRQSNDPTPTPPPATDS